MFSYRIQTQYEVKWHKLGKITETVLASSIACCHFSDYACLVLLFLDSRAQHLISQHIICRSAGLSEGKSDELAVKVMEEVNVMLTLASF